MKRNYVAHFLTICMLFSLFTSCKGLKKAQGDRAVDEATAILKKAEKEVLKYETLSISGRARVEMPEMDISGMSATYRISMMKDDRILIRISKIIEVFRILATRDSVYVMDKLNHNMIVCDYQLVEKMIGIEASYDLLHDLLTGNFHPVPGKLVLASNEDQAKMFTGSKANISFTYFINPEIHKVTKILAKQAASGAQTELNYDQFESYGETMMPMSGSASVQTSGGFNLDFTHRRVNINPENLSFDFNVPDNYARMDCK